MNVDHFEAFVAHLSFLVCCYLFELCLLHAHRANAFDYSRIDIIDGHSLLLLANHWMLLLLQLLPLFVTLQLAPLLISASLAKLARLVNPHDIAALALRLASEAVLCIVEI